MFNMLSPLKNKFQSFLDGQLGTVAWEYLLVIAGVSVVIIAAVAVGFPSLIKVVMVDLLCEQFDDLIPPGTQWACHGGIWPAGWYEPHHPSH